MLEAMRDENREGKYENDVRLRGWKRRLVPVGDSMATTGSVVVRGCGGEGGLGKRVWGLRLTGGAVKIR